jgi:taurine transport system ATP-binding protein
VTARSYSAAPPTRVVGGALEVRDVGHTYRSADGVTVKALERSNLTFEAGSFISVVGPSGCGKSTLLEILAGLRTPTEGEVRLGGRRVIGPARSRGVVFQQSSSLFPWRTVAKNVAYSLEIARVPRAARRSRVAVELERVGLSEFADRRVYELSGGMQQRTQIARALAADPEVLLLDEPFGALDTFTRERLQDELRGIWLDRRPTVVLVTHSVEEAAILGTRVLVMSSRPGRVVADHPIDFTTRDVSATALREAPDFVDFCARLRREIASGSASS